jgi:nitrite reductase/ring-hydroxylating ferredoxin subunit
MLGGMPSLGETRFVAALPLETLRREGRSVCRVGDKNLAFFWLDGRVYACDNACPHKGHPLIQGEIRGQSGAQGGDSAVLTCVWHNWKFSLPSGRCVLGGESVAVYPVEIRGDAVWVDTGGGHDPARQREQIRASLRKAMAKNKTGRMAKEAARLLSMESGDRDVFHEAVSWGCLYAEEGWDLGLCAAVDAFRAQSLFTKDETLLPLTQSLAAVAEPNLRREPRSLPPATSPPPSQPRREEFLRLVENEKAEESEALFRSAVNTRPVSELKGWLAEAASVHFLDRGQPLMYLHRACEALDVLGAEAASTILPGLVPAVVLATRMDKLPPMKETADFVNTLPEGTWEKLCALQKTGMPPLAADWLLESSAVDSMRRLLAHLEGGTPFESFCGAFALAGARRMLEFRVDIEADPRREEGWLDVTHLLTLPHALRHLWRARPTATLMRVLFYLADALHASSPLMGREDGDENVPAQAPQEILRALDEAFTHRFPSRATGAARRWFEAGADPKILLEHLRRRSLSDPAARHNYVTRMILITRAACEEYPACRGMEDAWKLPAAAARFMASPLCERGVTLSTHKALASLRKPS